MEASKCNHKGMCSPCREAEDCKYKESPKTARRGRPKGSKDKHPRKRKNAASEPPRPIAGGSLLAPDLTRRKLTGKRFVFTAAQNNTYLHEPFWQALVRFCDKQGASLHVSRFTYNKAGWKKHGGVSKDESDDSDKIWYDPKITSYVLDEQVKVADGLVFCGELDILPTASTPISTLSNYTGPNSGIVPHAKVQLQSFATMKHESAKFMYTTGACTLRNYIERKAGQVATFHHVFGALYVEVDEDGQWFARQLIADDNGIFFDIDTAYGPTWDAPASEFGDSIVTLGDIHVEKLDNNAFSTAVDMMQTIKPAHIFVHDLIDFKARNHHNLNDPHFIAKQYFSRGDSVRQNMNAGANFCYSLMALIPSATVHVVRSNHDQAFERWLREPSAQFDPANAQFWHECNALVYKNIHKKNFDVLTEVFNSFPCDVQRVHFIREDESVIINDIEYGMHGHRGPNGARGNPKAFRQLGRKANTGHTHSASIIDGVWTVGVLAELDMGYNSGPSSWSHTNCITYPNGKRAMITQKGTRWRA